MNANAKAPLTATEVEADPSVIRSPDARQRQRNRSGQKGGASKLHIPVEFSWRAIEMQRSPAYRVLSLSALRVMARLEIELAEHGGKPEENGQLPCTFEDFAEYGIERHAISPAIRELVALGFIEVTQKGCAGNAGFRRSQLYLLTYRHAGSDQIIKDGWRRIMSVDEAQLVAANARAKKSANQPAREFGRKGGVAAQLQKQKSSAGNPTDASAGNPTDASLIGGETPPMAQCGKPHHYLEFPGEGAGGRLANASPASPSPVTPTARRSSRMDAWLAQEYRSAAALVEARASPKAERGATQQAVSTAVEVSESEGGAARPQRNKLQWPPRYRELDLYTLDPIEPWLPLITPEPHEALWVMPMRSELVPPPTEGSAPLTIAA